MVNLSTQNTNTNSGTRNTTYLNTNKESELDINTDYKNSRKQSNVVDTSNSQTFHSNPRGEEENIQNNIASYNIEDIDELIKQNKQAKKHYSRTHVDVYTPLTRSEKVKFVEELSINSDKRLMLYSELFKEIKTQISSFSHNLSESFHETNNLDQVKRPFTKSKQSYFMNNIDEEQGDVIDLAEEVNVNFKPLKSNVSKVILKISNPALSLDKKTSNTMIDYDMKESDEMPGMIVIPQINCKSNSLQKVDDLAFKKLYSKTSILKNKRYIICIN